MREISCRTSWYIPKIVNNKNEIYERLGQKEKEESLSEDC